MQRTSIRSRRETTSRLLSTTAKQRPATGSETYKSEPLQLNEQRNNEPNFQFFFGARGHAAAGARGSAARSDFDARRRHVSDGDQPQVGNLREYSPPGHRPHAQSRRHSGELQSSDVAGRGESPVFDGSNEPAHQGSDGGLYRYRVLGGEGD